MNRDNARDYCTWNTGHNANPATTKLLGGRRKPKNPAETHRNIWKAKKSTQTVSWAPGAFKMIDGVFTEIKTGRQKERNIDRQIQIRWHTESVLEGYTDSRRDSQSEQQQNKSLYWFLKENMMGQYFSHVWSLAERPTPAVGFLLDLTEFQKSSRTSCVPEPHNIFRDNDGLPMGIHEGHHSKVTHKSLL